MKKILSLTLAFILCFSCLTLVVSAVDGYVGGSKALTRTSTDAPVRTETDASQIVSGMCGENASWDYYKSTRTLFISGTGAVDNYTSWTLPWSTYISQDYIKAIVVGKGITSIGSYVFYKAEKVYISDTVESVVQSAFLYDQNIIIDENNPYLSVDEKGVVFSDGGKTLLFTLKAIHNEYRIPEGVITVADGSMDSVYHDINSIYLSSTVKNITREAFAEDNEDRVPAVYVDESNPYYSSDDYGVLFNKDKTILYFSPVWHEYGGLPYDYYVVPETVKEISDRAFCNNAGESIALPEGLKKIGWAAFETNDQSDITLYIPSSITYLDVGFTDYYSGVYYGGTEEQWNNLYKGNNVIVKEYNHKHDIVSAKYSCVEVNECVICKTIVSVEVTKEHDWRIKDSLNNCEEGGFIYYNCRNCERTKTEYVEPKEHDWEIDEDFIVDYNCKKGGDHYLRCYSCGESKREYLEPKEHEFLDYPDAEELATFCGRRRFDLECANCPNGSVVIEGTKEHEWQYPDLSTFCGEREFDVECKNCDDYYQATFEGTSQNHHSYIAEDDKDPTCTEDGYKTEFCEYCGDEKTTVIPALGHNYNDKWTVLTDATCSQSGISINICKRCLDIDTLTTPAYGHFDDDADKKCDECKVVLDVSDTPTTPETPDEPDAPDEPEEPMQGTSIFANIKNFFNKIVEFFKQLFRRK